MTTPVIFFKFVDYDANKIQIVLSDSNDEENGIESYFCFILQHAKRGNRIFDALLLYLDTLPEDTRPERLIDHGLNCFMMKHPREMYITVCKFMKLNKYQVTWKSQFPEYMLDPTLYDTDLIPTNVLEHLHGITPTHIVTPDPNMISQVLDVLLGPPSFKPYMNNILITSDKDYQDFHENPHTCICDTVSNIGFPDITIDIIIIVDHKNEYFSDTNPFGRHLVPHRKLVYISTYPIMHPNFPYRPIYSEDYSIVVRRRELRPVSLVRMKADDEANILNEIIGNDNFTMALWSIKSLEKYKKNLDDTLADADIALADVLIYQDLPKLGVFVKHLMEIIESPVKCIVFLGEFTWNELYLYYNLVDSGKYLV